jgi:hypothetical protein
MADSRRMSRSSSSARGRCLCFLALVIGMLCGALPATGQTKPQSPTTTADDDPWRFNASLYGWMISVSGNVTARGQTVDTNASFIDLLQRSQSVSGVMGYFEADKGRVGVYLDLVYTNLGFDSSALNYRNPTPGLRITTTANTAMTYQLFVAEVGGVYEIARWQFSEKLFDRDRSGWRVPILEQLVHRRSRCGRKRRLLASASRALVWPDGRARECDPMGRSGRGRAPAAPVYASPADHPAWRCRRLRARQPVLVAGRRRLQLQLDPRRWPAPGGPARFRALSVNYSSGSGPDAVGINETLYGPVIGVSYRF